MRPAISNERLARLKGQAQQKAMELYGTDEITFISEFTCWEQCLQVEDMGKDFLVIFHFNVGPASHAVMERIEK